MDDNIVIHTVYKIITLEGGSFGHVIWTHGFERRMIGWADSLSVRPERRRQPIAKPLEVRCTPHCIHDGDHSGLRDAGTTSYGIRIILENSKNAIEGPSAA